MVQKTGRHGPPTFQEIRRVSVPAWLFPFYRLLRVVSVPAKAFVGARLAVEMPSRVPRSRPPTIGPRSRSSDFFSRPVRTSSWLNRYALPRRTAGACNPTLSRSVVNREWRHDVIHSREVLHGSDPSNPGLHARPHPSVGRHPASGARCFRRGKSLAKRASSARETGGCE